MVAEFLISAWICHGITLLNLKLMIVYIALARIKMYL